MPRETRHFKEEIQELLDNRLSPEARPEVEQHLKSCEECQRELEALRWTKQFSRRQFAPKSAPAKLEEDILKALDLEDRSASAKTASTQGWRWQRRAILAYGLVLAMGAALTLSYFILRAPRRQAPEATNEPASLPSAVARDYRNYQAEKLLLMLKTGEVKEMEKFFPAAGVTFDTRVFDLAMMDYHLVGGRIHHLLNRRSALFVYHGKDRQLLQPIPRR